MLTFLMFLLFQSGVASVQFFLDGQPISPALTTAPYTFQWDSKTVKDGSHVLVAKAKDAAGNEGVSAPVTFTVDNTAPTITITAPSTNGFVTGKTNVNATASDVQNIAKMELFINGASVKSTSNASSLSYSWNTKPYRRTTPSLAVVATDKGGNIQTKSFQVSVR